MRGEKMGMKAILAFGLLALLFAGCAGQANSQAMPGNGPAMSGAGGATGEAGNGIMMNSSSGSTMNGTGNQMMNESGNGTMMH